MEINEITEDRIENKMKKFEKIIKNSSCSCNVTSEFRTIQPATYDGQTPWSSYKKQFEASATTNSWEKE